MPDFSELEQRIDAMLARASSGQPSATLLVEIENLLAEGYLSALRADQRSRRLKRRVEALLEADSGSAAQELQAVVREQHMVAEATRELRSRLAAVRDQWVALGSERLGLA